MKYSVVIPLYNKQRYIKSTLQSVLAQTYTDYEVVVVDDGSTDASLQEAERMQSDKIRVLHQENQGVAVARNTGIENAAGEYIAFLDADDKWNPSYLEEIDKIVQKYPQSDIFVSAYEVDLGNGKKNLSEQMPAQDGCLPSYWATLSSKYDFVWTSATTIRKSALIQAGLFRPGEKIGQDLDMWARVARNNPKVAYTSSVCVTYNRQAESNARTRVKIAWAGAFIQDLEEELANGKHTQEEIKAIQKKYDAKMTVYIFTCLMAGEKTRARQALKDWKGSSTPRNVMLKTGLRVAGIMPASIKNMAYQIRLKIF
ncbi:glycosyltransferase family 2 protein [uncultured Gemmiger sp.]|uniref:glycosyltransferase family 2 protein n=1 Tax=uncultured Gemmiger sp. TaxID=1623490 RepID=UPI0025988DF6|nr:glycosyltransferase family 2 protein [uncultured Gemmiger sp.]